MVAYLVTEARRPNGEGGLVHSFWSCCKTRRVRVVGVGCGEGGLAIVHSSLP